MTPPSTSGIPLEPEELALLHAALESGDAESRSRATAARAVLTDRLLERGDDIGRWLALSRSAGLAPSDLAERDRLKRSAARYLLGDVDRVLASQGRWYRDGFLAGAQLHVQHPAHLEGARHHLMWRTLESLDLHWTSDRSEACAHFVGTNPTFAALTSVSVSHPDLLAVLVAYPDLPLRSLTLDVLPRRLASSLARSTTFPELESVRLRRLPEHDILLERPLRRLLVELNLKGDQRLGLRTRMERSRAEHVELRYGQAALRWDRRSDAWTATQPRTWQHDRLELALG
ncbi:MAG: hypothetical protein R3F61_16900 [Myxococcota bacterium]